LDLEIKDYLRFYPFVLIASLVPITVGGLGVREFANIAVFGTLGVPKHQCVSLGLMQYFMMLIIAIIGLSLFFMSGRERKEKLESEWRRKGEHDDIHCRSLL
jgi:uncharacterized membrane protein YbhN (UPF0104 family)